MNRSRHLARSSLLVFFLHILEKFTGLGKLFLMTRLFGTGAAADALTAANQLPELFLYALTGGAIAAALIPVYSAYLTSQRTEKAEALGNTVFTLTLVVLGCICGLTALAAPWISRVLLVPEFSPAQQALTAELMRIVLLSSVIVGVSSVFSSLLQAHQHFLAPALALSLIDLGQIFGLWVLVPRLGIHGVAWGSVIGAVLLLLTQLPALWSNGIRIRPALALKLAGSHEMAHLIWPRMVTLGVVQAVDLVFLRLASPLAAGSITAFFYALLVMVAMPKSLLTGTITAVFFPTLAEEYNAGRPGAMQATLFAGLRAAWLLVIPAAVGLLALGRPAVAFLFERGAFDEQSTGLVFGLMAIFALRLVMDSTQDVLSMGFYARHNTRIVMWANLGWAGLNVLLSALLVKPYGIAGLAWATTLASAALALTLYWLNRQMNRISGGERELCLALVRTGLACAGMAIAIAGIAQLRLDLIPFLATAIGGGSLVYFGLYSLLGGRELSAVWQHLAKTSDEEEEKNEQTATVRHR